MQVREIIDQVPSGVAGVAALATAAIGTVAQIITQFGTPLIILLNISLAIGGWYLLRLKIRREHAELARLNDGGGGT